MKSHGLFAYHSLPIFLSLLQKSFPIPNLQYLHMVHCGCGPWNCNSLLISSKLIFAGEKSWQSICLRQKIKAFMKIIHPKRKGKRSTHKLRPRTVTSEKCHFFSRERNVFCRLFFSQSGTWVDLRRRKYNPSWIMIESGKFFEATGLANKLDCFFP